jgi:hypothetical protein
MLWGSIWPCVPCAASTWILDEVNLTRKRMFCSRTIENCKLQSKNTHYYRKKGRDGTAMRVVEVRDLGIRDRFWYLERQSECGGSKITAAASKIAGWLCLGFCH